MRWLFQFNVFSIKKPINFKKILFNCLSFILKILQYLDYSKNCQEGMFTVNFLNRYIQVTIWAWFVRGQELRNTICPRSSDPFYITASWTDGTNFATLIFRANCYWTPMNPASILQKRKLFQLSLTTIWLNTGTRLKYNILNIFICWIDS